MISEIYDYIEAGFHVFGLHGASGGVCNCGDDKCKAVLKHPIMSNWQSVPRWSDEQIECFNDMGHFNSGFGVLCRGFLIVDVDARNGGVLSFMQLCNDVPSIKQCAFIVNTGSGGGSQHYYFKIPEAMHGQAFLQTLSAYKGIDFKTSGYVVGAGSLHISGATYEVEHGYPQDVADAPTELLALISRPAFYRVNNGGLDVDVDEGHIAALLGFVNADMGYNEWITIGMAIHHCLGGTGLDLWDDWSRTGAGYKGIYDLQKHWHSFGKSANPAGYGTLLHYAKEGGYCEPVTFVFDEENYNEDESEQAIDEPVNAVDANHNDDDNHIPVVVAHSAKHPLDEPVDLKRPPDFVGSLTEWINSQCLYPRENLAVAAALTAVSSLAGMRYSDTLDGMTANLFTFCVSGSATGKESVMQAYQDVLRAANVQSALHGGFKSEQEVMRNFIRNQAAFYCIDEFGITLNKLQNAVKRGGSPYLEGVVGILMSAYSKANGYLPITGDLKNDMRQALTLEYAQLDKKIENLPQDTSADAMRERLKESQEELLLAIQSVDDGLENPYLTLIGFTTGVTFNELMTFEMATNGFLARAMLFEDLETNPRRKNKFKKEKMPEYLANALRNLYSHGHYDSNESRGAGARIQQLGDKVPVPTTEDAQDALNEVYERFFALAEEHKNSTGLEAIARRGYEIAAKVSLVCALPSGLRTLEHVRFGYALAKQDIDKKIKLAYSTDNKKSADGLAARVLSLLEKGHGETLGVICSRLRGTSKPQVEALLAQMIIKKMIRQEEHIQKSNNKPFMKFFAV